MQLEFETLSLTGAMASSPDAPDAAAAFAAVSPREQLEAQMTEELLLALCKTDKKTWSMIPSASREHHDLACRRKNWQRNEAGAARQVQLMLARLGATYSAKGERPTRKMIEGLEQDVDFSALLAKTNELNRRADAEEMRQRDEQSRQRGQMLLGAIHIVGQMQMMQTFGMKPQVMPGKQPQLMAGFQHTVMAGTQCLPAMLPQGMPGCAKVQPIDGVKICLSKASEG